MLANSMYVTEAPTRLAMGLSMCGCSQLLHNMLAR